MRKEIYKRLEGYSSYIETNTLLKNGMTNRQINNLVREGFLEKIYHGYYWVVKEGDVKPKEYKAIEICMCNPKAIVCADTACFYHGLIEEEPSRFSVATSREDRSSLNMYFPVSRHYVIDTFFQNDYKIVTTEQGSYNIYDLERSVCDCIRFRKDIDEYVFELIVDTYREREDSTLSRLLAYAERLNILRQTEKILK